MVLHMATRSAPCSSRRTWRSNSMHCVTRSESWMTFRFGLPNSMKRAQRCRPVLITSRHACCLARGEFNAAVAALTSVHASLVELYGARHSNTLAALSDLALAQRSAGNLDDAEMALTQLIATRTELHGPLHIDTVSARHSLGRLQLARENPAAARAQFEDVVSARRAALGGNPR